MLNVWVGYLSMFKLCWHYWPGLGQMLERDDMVVTAEAVVTLETVVTCETL